MSTRLRKNRSTRFSRQASASFARYAETTVMLCARYHARAVGVRMNSRVAATLAVRGEPGRPKAMADASQVSRSSESLTERHHGLPGDEAHSEFSKPRLICQRMNAEAARRNGR